MFTSLVQTVNIMDETNFEILLKNSQRKNDVYKITSLDIESAVPKGQNFASDVTRCKMNVVLKSGKNAKKRLIIKRMPQGKAGEVLKMETVFELEIKVYDKILKVMGNFMDDYNDKSHKMWGEMLDFNPYNTIIFEDLTVENFKNADKTLGLDLKHSELVLKNLGRFHGLSNILMDDGFISEDDLPVYYAIRDDNAETLTKHLFQGGLELLGNVVSTDWPDEMKYLGERLKKESKNVCKKLVQLKGGENVFKVVNHGDLWTCNMMFKYSDDVPTQVKFIDFQTAHIESYGWDLIYFLYTTVRHDVRKEHLDRLLEIYQNALSSTLKYYGRKKKSPTLDDVKNEIKRLKYYAFIVLSVIYPITNSDSQTAMDLDRLLIQSPTDPEILKDKKYIKNAGKDLKLYAEDGCF